MNITKTLLSLGLASVVMQSVAISECEAAGADAQNPLLQKSSLAFGAPDFNKIKPSDYLPAIKAAILTHESD